MKGDLKIGQKVKYSTELLRRRNVYNGICHWQPSNVSLKVGYIIGKRTLRNGEHNWEERTFYFTDSVIAYQVAPSLYQRASMVRPEDLTIIEDNDL